MNDNTPHHRCRCLGCLELQGPPDLAELRKILFAGPLALVNGLRPRDPESDSVLERIIAEHQAPDVSYRSLVAFEQMWMASSLVSYGLIWLYLGFEVAANIFGLLFAVAFLTLLVADEVDMEP